jgi:hypothetical protein
VFNPGNLLRAGKQDRQQGGAERSRKFHESIQYISDWGVNPKVGKHSAWNAVWMRKGCGKDADISAGKLFRRRILRTGFISIKGRDTGNRISSGKAEDVGRAGCSRSSGD